MVDLQNILVQRPLGLVFDIDGTLSPIAPTPGEARLYPGVAESLTRARQYAQVAIMTGRAVDNGAAMVNIEGLVYVGTHGAEWSYGLPSQHEVQINSAALPWIEPGEELLALAEQKLGHLPGVLIEHKRLGGSIHYRLAPDPDAVREIILDTLREPALARHFRLAEGKRVVDVKADLNINKGQALRQFVETYQLTSVVFAGDDRTDLDAMLEIERLREEGVQGVSIVVQAIETLPALLEHADIIVPGVESMALLLQDIVEQLEIS